MSEFETRKRRYMSHGVPEATAEATVTSEMLIEAASGQYVSNTESNIQSISDEEIFSAMIQSYTERGGGLAGSQAAEATRKRLMEKSKQ